MGFGETGGLHDGLAKGAQALKQSPCILFVDRRNDALSQMAEGFARDLWPGRFRIKSAGVAPDRVCPWAIQVMAEVGIDISDHYTKALSLINFEDVKHVIILEADLYPVEIKPPLMSTVWHLHNPADIQMPSHAMLSAFRLVREVIQSRLQTLYAHRALNRFELL